MLVLARKKNESIVIGEATITVVEIRGDKVRLGIEAPRDVHVHRPEALELQRARKLFDQLLPRLQTQLASRTEHGLTWADPAELKGMPDVALPTDDPTCSRLVLHVDSNISADELARAYGIPALPPGTWHAVAQRPSRPYLLILEHAGTGESSPENPVDVLLGAELQRRQRWSTMSPLLPLELLLLALEQPEAFQDRGLTAAGAVNAEQMPAVDWQPPDMYRHRYKMEPVIAALRDAFQNAYFPSLVRLPDGAFHWVLHQGPHGGYGIPLARHIV